MDLLHRVVAPGVRMALKLHQVGGGHGGDTRRDTHDPPELLLRVGCAVGHVGDPQEPPLGMGRAWGSCRWGWGGGG